MLVPTNKVAAGFVSGSELSGFAGRCSQRPLHDGAGNPTSYFNPGDLSTWTLSWRNGRELGKAVKSGTTLSFDYDVNGLRTWKQVDGVRHNYTYASGLLLRESYSQNGTDYTLDFLYDLNNRPYMLYLTTKTGSTTTSRPYYYILNLQGDVVHLVNTAGKAMASYAYDPYGAVISKSGEFADLNPIRYRGYYYDTETGFYYLQSRYYDPALGRFINADSYTSTGTGYLGYNMFAYCNNNPVNMFDGEGEWPGWLKKAVAAVAVVAVVAAAAAVTVATAGAGSAAAVIAVGAAKGAAVGMLSGAASGAALGAAGHRLSTGSWDGAGSAALDGMGTGALSGAISGAVTGGVKRVLNVSKAAKISTGRTQPNSLNEQIAMKAVKSNPKAGKIILTSLGDKKLPKGTVKPELSGRIQRPSCLLPTGMVFGKNGAPNSTVRTLGRSRSRLGNYHDRDNHAVLFGWRLPCVFSISNRRL